MPNSNMTINVPLLVAVILMSNSVFAASPKIDTDELAYPVYDEVAYTQYVEDTMKKLDKLYLEFCYSCGVDAVTAGKARQEFLVSVHELMQYMNSRFDSLDPKRGAALSPTESLVSIHALTMLVDILAATQLEQMTPHPYNE